MEKTTWSNVLSVRVISTRTGKQVFYKECALVDTSARGNNELVLWYADCNGELQMTTYTITGWYWYEVQPLNLRDVMHVSEE